MEKSRSPDLVEGRVVPVPLLLVESLLGPPRVFGRPAAPFAGFGFLAAVVAVAGFLGVASVRLFGCGAVPGFVAFPIALPLPLLARVLGYVILSSSPGLLSRLRARRVSRAICSLGIGTGLVFETGIRDEPFPLLFDTLYPSTSSRISSGNLRSQLGTGVMSRVLVSVEVAAEFFLDLEGACSEPPIDLPDPLTLSWLGSRLDLFWLFDLALSLWRGKKMPAACSSSFSILANLSR